MQQISTKGCKVCWSANDLGVELTRCLGVVEKTNLSIENNTKNTIIKAADSALEHRLFVLGSDGSPIEPLAWNKDIKTGFEWTDGKFYLDYKIINNANNSDVKVPWELSRCHHLLWLGEAYLLTGGQKYADEVVFEINHWIDHNPFMRSINWTCAMDVAIRAVNWMYALCMIKKSSAFTDKFADKVTLSLFQHGFFIFSNLEKNFPYSHNHYDSDLAGLVYLGSLFKDTKKGQQWLDFASEELFQEIRSQVLPSGAHFERSLSYHRLVTELFSYSLYVLKRIGHFVPHDIPFRISLMYSFIKNYLPNSGFAPTIEDNDDGRFLPFVPRDIRDHSYLVNEHSLEAVIASIDVSSHWQSEGLISSKVYNDVGYAFLRRNNAYLCVVNGGQSKFETNEKRVGSHTHNDLLSFVFSLEEDDIIVDPGTYVYTADCNMRNLFRSTCMHNTIIVDGEEQNFLPEKEVFVIEKNVKIGGLLLKDIEDSCHLQGDYSTIQGGMNHIRKLRLTDEYINILDEVKKEGINHNLKMFLHLSNGIKEVRSNNNCIELESDHYRLNLVFESDSIMTVSVEDGYVSPSYGVLQSSKTIVAQTNFNEVINLNTKIKWQKI